MHHALITPQSGGEQLATLAAGALDAASRQQTGPSASATYHNPDGTKTLMGEDAAGQGIAQWVGDTTPPGVPTGVTARSGSGLILVSWDGTLDGGVPPDFAHVQILVDGTDAGSMRAAGTVAVGPYGIGSLHMVTAVAWDDAHAEDGSPAPNASPACAPVQVIVTGADIDPGRLGITVTKSDKDPQGQGEHTGDLWLRYAQGYGDNMVSDPRGTDFAGKWTYTGMGGTSVSRDGATWIRTRPYGSDRWSDLVNTASTQVLHDGDRVRVSARIKAEAYKASQCEVYIGVRASKGGSDLSKVTTVTVSGWTTATVDLPITKAGKDGDTFQFVLSVHSTAPSTDTIILATDFGLEPPSRSVLEGEWWWDGTAWVQIPVAIYLDQLAVRDVQVDEAVVGMLAAGIIKSGTFVTDDGLVGFDSTGFWVRDTSGNLIFQAGKDGVQAVGGFATATSGNRIIMSQTLVKGTSIGGIQGQDSNDTSTPNWFIWGYGSRTAKDGYPTLLMGVSTDYPEIGVSKTSYGTSAGIQATDTTINGEQYASLGAGKELYITAPSLKIQGIKAGFANFFTGDITTNDLNFTGDVDDYQRCTYLGQRAGIYSLDLRAKRKTGVFPKGQRIKCATLSDKVMPASALDAWIYGEPETLVHLHIAGPGEDQPQGTISVTAKDGSPTYVYGQLIWVQE